MKISIVGDTAFTGLISNESENNYSRFKSIIPILSESDLVICNLEVPIKADESSNEYKNFTHFSLYGPSRDLFIKLNLGCVSLANNHIYDYKMSGLKKTIDCLDDLGIYHTGAGWLSSHIEPAIIQLDGIKIGFMAYVDKNTNPNTEKFPELFINYIDGNKVLSDIEKIRSNVDKIILSLHWGNDYSYYPTNKQISIAHKFIEAGVDLIMGHHPHTLQPFEKYNNGYSFYSIGNFVFGDYIQNGKLFALPRRAKKSVIINWDLYEDNFTFISTKESIGNYLNVTSINYLEWSNKKWKQLKIKNSSKLMTWIFNFNEVVLFRIYEYFFGYYRNPILRLLDLKNFKKIFRTFRYLKIRNTQSE